MLKGMRKEDLDRCIKVKPTSWFCPELDVVRRDHFRTVDRKGTSTVRKYVQVFFSPAPVPEAIERGLYFLMYTNIFSLLHSEK